MIGATHEQEESIVIWSFLAGMVCGAALLVALILVSDKSFLDLISGQVADRSSDGAERAQPVESQRVRSLAAGGDS